MYKKCSSCNQIKDLTFFKKRKTSKDGYQGQCQICCKEYMKKYYLRNADKVTKNALLRYYKRTDGLCIRTKLDNPINYKDKIPKFNTRIVLKI
jgi:hypothetical protein